MSLCRKPAQRVHGIGSKSATIERAKTERAKTERAKTERAKIERAKIERAKIEKSIQLNPQPLNDTAVFPSLRLNQLSKRLG